MLRKATEIDVRAAGFGIKIGGLRPSNAFQGFFDSLEAHLTASFFAGNCRYRFRASRKLSARPAKSVDTMTVRGAASL